MVESDCIDNTLVPLPHSLQINSDPFFLTLDIGTKARYDNLGRWLVIFNTLHFSDGVDALFGDFLVQDLLELVVSVVLQDGLKGVRMLVLGDTSV